MQAQVIQGGRSASVRNKWRIATRHWSLAFVALALLEFTEHRLYSEVPGLLSYQGVVTTNGTRFDGNGLFKFALIDGTSPVPLTLWRNDGSASGDEPEKAVPVPVHQGLFQLLLGDSQLPNMIPVTPSVFTNQGVSLRIWFKEADAPGAFSLLSPDQRLTSVGFSMLAANVENASITTAKLLDGAVTTPKLANGSVTVDKLAPNVISGSVVLDHSLTSSDLADVLSLRELNLQTAAGLHRIELSGSGDSGVLRMNHGSVGRFLEMEGTTDGGFFRLFDKLGGELTGQTTVELGSSSVGGYGRWFQDNGSVGVHINGQNGGLPGGTVLLYRSTGLGVVLQGQLGSGGGQVEVRDASNESRVQLRGDHATFQLLNAAGSSPTLKATGDAGDLVALTRVGVANSVDASVLQASLGKDDNGGLIRTRDEKDNTTALIASGAEGGYMRLYRGSQNGQVFEGVVLDGDDGNGGALAVKDGNGTSTVRLIGAQTSTTGGRVELYQAAGGTATVVLDGEVGTGGGGYLQLRKGDGTPTITLDSDVSGEGRITTQVLQITGGSDLSEQFNVQERGAELLPGMIVCIDAEHPGELALSRGEYDRTVAGVISGAGGVKPGMLMSQTGTAADGKHAVALTGRVYCFVDADAGPVQPGDFITTSSIPGHGMKVKDSSRATGAVIGKAMSRLDRGQGLVLVLVSLQ